HVAEIHARVVFLGGAAGEADGEREPAAWADQHDWKLQRSGTEPAGRVGILISHRAASMRADHLARNGDLITPRLWPHLPNVTLALLRVVTGLLFMEHGIQKFFGTLIPPGQPPMPAPGMFTQMWFAGSLELVGGALIVLGLFTRVV